MYKEISNQHLHSEKGFELRRRRGPEIESCFGDFKHNMGFSLRDSNGLCKAKSHLLLVEDI